MTKTEPRQLREEHRMLKLDAHKTAPMTVLRPKQKNLDNYNRAILEAVATAEKRMEVIMEGFRQQTKKPTNRHTNNEAPTTEKQTDLVTEALLGLPSTLTESCPAAPQAGLARATDVSREPALRSPSPRPQDHRAHGEAPQAARKVQGAKPGQGQA